MNKDIIRDELIKAKAILPAVCTRIQDNAVGERIRLAGGNGWDMVFITVDDVEDLERGLLEHVFHCSADFGAFCV